MSLREHRIEVDVFGGRTAIAVAGRAGDGTSPQLAAATAAARLRRIHLALTRFDPGSELSRLNADPRPLVPASPLLRRLAAAVREAGELSEGLVDATRLEALVEAGYGASRAGRPGLPAGELAAVAATGPAHPHPDARWRAVEVRGDAVARPPGTMLDPGGLGKGLACDLIAAGLAGHPLFAVDCSGDLRFGGTAARPRELRVGDPFGGPPAALWTRASGAAATSGIVNRSWRGPGGAVSHHLIDPGRGVPAMTGVLQATALAPTALEAEVRAKAALLAGPLGATARLVHGGALVLAGGELREVEPVAAPRRRAA